MTDPLARNCADASDGCDALAGEPCRTVYGHPLDRPHPARTAMAGTEWEPEWAGLPASHDWVPLVKPSPDVA